MPQGGSRRPGPTSTKPLANTRRQGRDDSRRPLPHAGGVRAALTDRVAQTARKSRWTAQQLQRQVAYDRLLERLYLVDDGWVVKGATALLARDLGMRGSLDVDLYREVGREVAETDLRRAAALDVGDWFRFEVGMASRQREGPQLPCYRHHRGDDLGRVPRRPGRYRPPYDRAT